MLLALPIAGLGAACGGHGQALSDGSWYGKIVAVDAQHRTLTLAPACRLVSGRWTAVARRKRQAVPLARKASLEIYYRPNGSAAAGHGQSLGLRRFKDVAERGSLPDFPPGWYVRIDRGRAVSAQEDSGVRSSGSADRKRFACIWSAGTQRFVRRNATGGDPRLRADPPLLVPWKRIGDIWLGESRQRVTREYGGPGRGFHVITPITGGLQGYYRLHGGRVDLTIQDGRVEEIDAGVPYYRTRSGFGVGSRIPFGPCVRTWTHPCGHWWHGFVWNEFYREVPCGCWVKVGLGKRSLAPATARFGQPWFLIYVRRGRVVFFRFATNFVD